MNVKARVVHQFQHDRFYAVGDVVSFPEATFRDLESVGLVVDVEKKETKPLTRETAKPRAVKQ
jgi:hypothetical protein